MKQHFLARTPPLVLVLTVLATLQAVAPHPYPLSYPAALKNIPKPSTHAEAARIHSLARAVGHRARRRAGVTQTTQPSAPTCASSDSAYRVSPASYGGDPTGATE
jgi:hypothetical protein